MVLLLFLAALSLTGSAAAQGVQTGTLSGTVKDAGDLVLPGVTITATSPALQGERSSVTDANGVYVLRGLPPGTYQVRFELSGMSALTQAARVEVGKDVQVNATLTPAGVAETVNVTARTIESTIVAPVGGQNFKYDEIQSAADRPQPAAIAELAPGLTANTPNADQVTISGAFAYDNVFLVDGVDINDNLFGSPDDLFIEDAIEQTQVITSGISAEYGRFSGGVINAITKSGGNMFSGSFRTDLTNPSWRDENPFEEENDTTRPDDWTRSIRRPSAGRSCATALVLRGRALGGPTNSQPLPQTGVPFDAATTTKRGEVKLTGTVANGHTLQGSYFNNSLEQDPRRRSRSASIHRRASAPRRRATASSPTIAACCGRISSPRRSSRRRARLPQQRRHVDTTSSTRRSSPDAGARRTTTRRTSTRPTPKIATTGSSPAACRGPDDDGQGGSHDFKGGFERVQQQPTPAATRSRRPTTCTTPTTSPTSRAIPSTTRRASFIPIFVPGESYHRELDPDARREIDITTMSLYVQDHVARSARNWTFDLGAALRARPQRRHRRHRRRRHGHLRAAAGRVLRPARQRQVARPGHVCALRRASTARRSSRANTNVGNPSHIARHLHGTGGPGPRTSRLASIRRTTRRSSAIFPTANVFFEDGLSSPVTKEFTASVGVAARSRLSCKGTYVHRNDQQLRRRLHRPRRRPDRRHQRRRRLRHVPERTIGTPTSGARLRGLQFQGRIPAPRWTLQGTTRCS